MIRVAIEALSRAFDGVAAVDGATLEVRPGELLAVLGPSGAGKTALARLIAGLDSPDSGDVLFDGRSILKLPPHERKVGLIASDDALWPHLTVAENVGYGPRVRGASRKERRDRVVEALGSARIDSLAESRPASLSPSQKARAALARALVSDPALLLLDDPTARLDPRGRAEYRDEIRRVHAEAETTTLFLTSDPREALALGDRLAILDLGRIVQVAAPHEVYNAPADALVAQLLGPVNLIQGQAEGEDARGGLIVRTPLGRLIASLTGEPPTPGSPITLAIRPEAFGLAPPIPADANRFPATIERQVFLGTTRQVFLRGPNDWPITATALQSQSQGLREGQNLTVSVLPSMVVVLAGRKMVGS